MNKMPEQIKKTSIKPFRDKLNALDLYVHEFRVDEDIGDDSHIFPDQYLVKLEKYSNFSEVIVDLSVKYSMSDMKDLVPESEKQNPPLKLVIIARGSRTSVREKVFEKEITEYESGDKFSIELDKECYRGKLLLQPYVVRSQTKRTPDTYAQRESSKVSSGKEWLLRFDIFDDIGNTGLDTRWQNFSENDTKHPLTENMLYYLSLDREANPVLWLNSEQTEIKNVLDKEGTRGVDARMRDVFFNSITVPVHIELIMSALRDLDSDTLEFSYDWQRSIVLSNADEILYDEIAANRETKLEKLLEIREKEDGMRRLVSRIQKGLQEKERPLKLMNNLIDEVNR